MEVVTTRPELQSNTVEAPQLRTLLLTDLCDSTALVERLGDAPAAELFRDHDALVMQLQQRWRGRLIDRSDGLLLVFERALDGLGFALDYTRGLRDLSQSRKITLQARAGLHVGEVLSWRNSDEAVRLGAKPLEVEGLTKPMAARLMSLARPGQILLSAVAEPLAHRAARELGERSQHLIWKSYGRWRFKGVPMSQEIYEVGEPDLAPLRAPNHTAKAWRDIPLWRQPAVLATELALVASLGIGAWLFTRPEPAIAFAERDWVVVGDLRNLTGQTTLDDSLEQAFRISLEQSRYVNVLSDMKARDTLQRMQRPEDTQLDRAIASEIAIRDGARAVILPTVAEVGGRVRVSAEVIDPHSQTTVYAQSADGVGVSSTLDSIDEVTAALRGKLGESISSIERSSKPLEQVTTSSLEALRAFSLAIIAKSEARNDQAMALYRRAIELDPDFAMAYLRMGFIAYTANEMEEAERYLKLASSKRDRLNVRESLLLDASLAAFSEPETAQQHWKLLATMFPDEYRAYQNYSYFGWKDAQEYAASLQFIGPATALKNPSRRNAYYLLGVLNLSQEKYLEALSAFKQAEQLGLRGFKRDYAETYAVQRRYEYAARVLHSQTENGDSSQDIEQRLGEISFPLDQGLWDKAMVATIKLEQLAKVTAPQIGMTYQGIHLSLRSYHPDKAFHTDLREYLGQQMALLAKVNVLEKRHLVFGILATGWMAAYTGDKETAQQALEVAGNAAGGYPANSDMSLLVQAELHMMANRPKTAIKALHPRTAQGNELYFLHAVLMRAYAQDKQYSKALQQADWLASHRGRAYSEFNSHNLWQPVNVLESNLALISASRYAAKLGLVTLAKEKQAAFAAAWGDESQGGELMLQGNRFKN